MEILILIVKTLGRTQRTNSGIGRGKKSVLKELKNRGFTMVEGLPLNYRRLGFGSRNRLLITISQAWANRPATRDAFDAHVNGVAHFLSALLDDASLPALASGGESEEIIALRSPTGFGETEDPLVSFYLKEAPPLFLNPHGKSVKVRTYLYP